MNPSVSCWTVSEQAAIDEVLGMVSSEGSRRAGWAALDVAGPLAVVLDAPDVRWATVAP